MIQDSDLQDGQRIFMLQEGKFWPAKLNTTQLPDVYSIILEKQRGNRPIILPRDDILNEAVSFHSWASAYFRGRLYDQFLVGDVRPRTRRSTSSHESAETIQASFLSII